MLKIFFPWLIKLDYTILPSYFSLGNKEKEQSKGKNKGKTGKKTVRLQYQ